MLVEHRGIQGGIDDTLRSEKETFTVNLPCAMTSTNYCVTLTKWRLSSSSKDIVHASHAVTARSTTSFSVFIAYSYRWAEAKLMWVVQGY